MSEDEDAEGQTADLAGVLRQRIATRLRALELTPITAATKAGLPRDTLRNLFRQDGSLPRIDTLAKIADALETTVAYLTGETAFPGNVYDDETRELAAHAMNTAKPIPIMGATMTPAPWPDGTDETYGVLSLNVPGFEDVQLAALVISANDHSMEPQYEPVEFVVWANDLEVGLRDMDDVIIVRETEQEDLFEWAVRRLLLEGGTTAAPQGMLIALADDDGEIGDEDPFPPIPFWDGKTPGGWQVMGVVVAKQAFYLRRPKATTFPSLAKPPPGARKKTTQ
ncbi:MAG: helix-turn-helix transcriptional regulator [Phenylobacterium sp.]|nr:helix-turn-helix transcriptional regulator [Phenylobacterium sp.]